MPSYPVNHSLYVLLWNKYKPVLVKLMRDSAEEPQEYQFIAHEFRDLNPKERGGHSFTLEAHRRRAQNNIKMSVVAQDLLEILIKSNTAYELMEEAMYEFTMDKQFKLTVTRHEVETATEQEEEAAPVENETKEEEKESA
ncbi:hypothetical protein [Ekhidna sp.]|uniref:hypothetical protein n=1 Tax=Ekhidna sp. TaxID=2608089 RepID=UPI003297417B